MDQFTYDWRDIASRAAWTFLQAFAAVALALVTTDQWQDVSAWTPAFAAGLGAVLSFAKNVASQRLTHKRTQQLDQ